MKTRAVILILALFRGGTINGSASDYFKTFLYSAHQAGNTYYQLAKKNAQSHDHGMLTDAHIYTNTLLVHLFFPIYFSINSSESIASVSRHDLLRHAHDFGAASYASFILPAIGALLLSYFAYHCTKKIIKLIKS